MRVKLDFDGLMLHLRMNKKQIAETVGVSKELMSYYIRCGGIPVTRLTQFEQKLGEVVHNFRLEE